MNEAERDLLLTAVDALDGLLSSHAAEAVRRARGESLTADDEAVERQVLFATLRRLRRAAGPVTAEAALDGDSKATGDDEAKP